MRRGEAPHRSGVVRPQSVLQCADDQHLDVIRPRPDSLGHVALPGLIADVAGRLTVHRDLGDASIPVRQLDEVPGGRLRHLEVLPIGDPFCVEGMTLHVPARRLQAVAVHQELRPTVANCRDTQFRRHVRDGHSADRCRVDVCVRRGEELNFTQSDERVILAGVTGRVGHAVVIREDVELDELHALAPDTKRLRKTLCRVGRRSGRLDQLERAEAGERVSQSALGNGDLDLLDTQPGPGRFVVVPDLDHAKVTRAAQIEYQERVAVVFAVTASTGTEADPAAEPHVAVGRRGMPRTSSAQFQRRVGHDHEA